MWGKFVRSSASFEHKCAQCSTELHTSDKHIKCVKCLGAKHNISLCGNCKKLPPAIMTQRLKMIKQFNESGTWPTTGEEDRSSVVSFKTALTHQPNDNTNNPQDINVDTDQEVVQQEVDREGAQEIEIVEQEVEQDQEDVVEEVEPELEVTMVNPIGGAPQIDNEMFRRYQAFLALEERERQQSQVVAKKKDSSKRKQDDISNHPEFKGLKSQVVSLDAKMDILINKLSGDNAQNNNSPQVQAPQPIPPSGVGAIPKRRRVGNVPNIMSGPFDSGMTSVSRARNVPMHLQSAHLQSAQNIPDLVVEDLVGGDDQYDQDYNYDDNDGEDEYMDPWESQGLEDIPNKDELSRRAAREIWLAALPVVCPELPTVKQVEHGAKGKFFKTLKKKSGPAKMPFLQDVVDMCVDSESFTNTKGVLTKVEKGYVTEDSVEKELLTPRNVPYTLSKEVPVKHLKDQGLRDDVNRLHPKTMFGLQERMSLESSRFSCAYLRICNNFQLALTAVEEQLETCKLKADLIGSKALHDEEDQQMIRNDMEDLIESFNTMALGIRDMCTSNGDFLVTASNQFNSANRERVSAWVEATALPKSVKAQVLKYNPDNPKGGVEPLNIVSQDAQTFVTTFVENRKDQNERQLLLKSLKPNPPKPPQKQKAQFQYKTPLQEQFQDFTKAQTSWNSSGNTRGAPRGRGRGVRGTRGRGRGRANSRPFPRGGQRGKQ